VKALKMILALFSALILCFGLCVPIYAEPIHKGRADISISGKSAILINAENGDVYYEKNADQRLGMASTTKLMTAIVALELCHPDTVITIPQEAVGVEGSSVYLVRGERLTLKELLYALLLSSANDAAVAIAVGTAGSVDGFVDKMNCVARDMGLTQTNFVNPHGLFDDNHYTTAHELAKIARAALENELISEIVRSLKATIPHDGIEGKRLLVNHNRLLKGYDGAIGMKTGFTKKTGRCLVSAAKRNGLTLIVVTLDAPDDWRDHAALLDYGFDSYERIIFYSAGELTYSYPLSDGEKDTVALTNAEPLILTVRRGARELDITVEAPARFIVGETKKGERFGSVTVMADGISVSSPLVISENINGRTKAQKGFFERIFTFFSIDD